jgi:protein gp37
MNKTKIPWCDFTWNPIRGCTPVSVGCDNCYAERMAKRFDGKCDACNGSGRIMLEHPGCPQCNGTGNNDEYFKPTMIPERLDQPLYWKKPRMVFVGSMGDLFHKDISDVFISKIYDVMKRCDQHIFQVLTKRPERMRDFINDRYGKALRFPNHIWHGVTIENQEMTKRLPVLFSFPSDVRFVSIEPMLGSIDLRPFFLWDKNNKDQKHWFHDPINRLLSWVIVGGETGPNARLCRESWVADIYDQCRAAKVPFFFKNYGRWWERHADWWCEHCQQWVPPEAVTSYETHDERCGGCGHRIHHSGFFNWEERKEWPAAAKK